ncbi:MAG: deoxyribodipyrimidine photo-lyase [Sandaracinaceae bacterium]
MPVPRIRLRDVNDAPVHADRPMVLYWMIAHRRTGDNHALDRALEWCRELDRPLVIFEPLRVGYEHASTRLHRFVVDGMADHRAACEEAGVTYLAYLEPEAGAGKGLLAALAGQAAVVVTDDYPTFFLPRMLAAAGRALDVRLEAVAANGLLPLRAADREVPTARGFRSFSQRALPEALAAAPLADPLRDPGPGGRWALPSSIADRWPMSGPDDLADPGALVDGLPVDGSVGPTELRGGVRAGLERWRAFLGSDAYQGYDADRNHPDEDAQSGLSPYLHFGHLGPHRLFRELAEHEGWSLGDQADGATGKREGFWHMGASAEAFLEQLTVWRELSLNGAYHQGEAVRTHDALPSWARKTLGEHEDDPRDPCYDLETLDAARTHDELWNAAQHQLRTEGRIHNYLRMLWGKKILEWSPSPAEALTRMIHLNDRYALDGRDPNSYAGITWVLGRYDRAWGPERPIYGKVRYMTSGSARRKLRLSGYLERYRPGA